jgi:mercuric ion binding protein
MKKFFALSLMVLSLNSFASQIKIKVSGMVCSMCAQGIQKKFSSESSIKGLKVNMDEKLVTLETHQGKDISDETIKKLISEAGYNVAGIERQ